MLPQIIRRALVIFVLVFSNLFLINPQISNAVTVGSGSCTSTSTTSSVVVASSGGFCYLAFTTTGQNNWTPPAGATSINFLLLAGGGAGGAGAWGGGGGAGELVSYTNYSVSAASPLSFSIGAGGLTGTASLTPSENRSNPGVNSWIGSSSDVVAVGGGAGASYAYGSTPSSNAVGGNGGSGGGGTEYGTVQNGGVPTASSGGTRTGYGNSGGKGGAGASTQSGGGGGGAGTAGANAGTGIGGNGGNGSNEFSSWLSAITSGMSGVTGWQTATSSGYIAGGGGGGTTTTAGTAGYGGGGIGANGSTLNGGNAISNTGSGGGGASYAGAARTGGSGGSGILIIRYVSDSTAPTFPSAETFNTPENTTSVGTITASESATITIFGGEDQSKFSIARLTDSSTALSFISAPNFEAPTDVGANNTYIVVVRAVDTAANAGFETVTVTVTNVNEAPSITIASSTASHSITQAENISSVLTYTGSDVDTGTTLTWSVSGTDASAFAIGSATGVLTFVSSPDFEAPTDSDTNNTYIFIVTLSDGALTDTQTVTLTITNANETASLGTPSLSATPIKGVLLTITVTSTVGGKVRFFINGKRIGGCLARSTTGTYPNFSATCSWKPTVMNRQSLTARIIPTDTTFSATTSASLSILVGRRTTTR